MPRSRSRSHASPHQPARSRNPLRSSRSGGSAQDPGAAAEGSLFRILCIDDDGIVAAARRLLLVRSGCSVASTPDPLEGLRLFRDGAFDAVLFDSVLPLMLSRDVATLMRHIRSASALILLSGSGEVCTEEPWVFDRCLPRRLSPQLLLQTLTDLLTSRRRAPHPYSAAASREALPAAHQVGATVLAFPCAGPGCGLSDRPHRLQLVVKETLQ